MARDSQRSRKGYGKKIERLVFWAACVARNGEAPPTKDKLSQEAVKNYEERKIPILQDVWEEFIAALFFRAIEAGENGARLNFRLIELWCEKTELDALETHDALNGMLCAVNKEQIRKIEQEAKKMRARGKKR